MLNLLQISFHQGPNLLDNATGSEQAFKVSLNCICITHHVTL